MTLVVLLGRARWAGPVRWMMYVTIALGLATWFAVHALRLEGYDLHVPFADEIVTGRALRTQTYPALVVAVAAAALGTLSALVSMVLVLRTTWRSTRV